MKKGTEIFVIFIIFSSCIWKRGGKEEFITPDIAFEKGLYLFYKKDYKKAREYFNKVIYAGKILDITDDAQFYIAKSFLLEKDYETAISELNFLISQFPNSEHTEEAEFLIVQSYAVKVKTIEHDEEDIKIALEKLKRFLDKYPDSHYKEEARYLQKRLENLLAHKIFKIAELYEKLKRFSSAEIYYRDVMEKYPGTIWAEKAENRLKEIRQKK